MFVFLLFLIQYINGIYMIDDVLRTSRIQSSIDRVFYSSIPQKIQTNDVVCIPSDVTLVQAIVLRFSSEILLQPRIKFIDRFQNIYFKRRAHLYVQLFPPSFFINSTCFQVDVGSSNITGYIQIIYKNSNNHSSKLITTMISTDPCITRRVKCKNGGRCQVLSNKQTKCVCPEHISGNNCENVGIRCGNMICINGGICSFDHQSCRCPLGTQGPDCSIKCGESYIQPNASSDRIINGESAVKNSWPYIVYIQIGDFGWCGGSLIDSWTVLTAAHCTYDRDLDEFSLWFGVHKLDEREMDMEMGIVETRSISAIINHPNYKIHPIKTFQNDLALLRLEKSVDETAYIRYLCIPPNNDQIIDLYLNHQLKIIGWGYINKQLSDGTIIRRTNELQQATISVLPDSDCMEYEKNNIILFQSSLMICAGTKDYKTDSCQGDSGGPLLMEYNHRWYAVGLVSFGSVECAKTGAAGVYTRLSVYSEWISQHLIS